MLKANSYYYEIPQYQLLKIWRTKVYKSTDIYSWFSNPYFYLNLNWWIYQVFAKWWTIGWVAPYGIVCKPWRFSQNLLLIFILTSFVSSSFHPHLSYIKNFFWWYINIIWKSRETYLKFVFTKFYSDRLSCMFMWTPLICQKLYQISTSYNG